MHPATVIVIAIYMVGILLMGFFLSKNVKSTKDYIVASRSANRYIVAFSIAATWISGATLIAATGMGVSQGSSTYLQYLGFMGATVWFGIYLMPKLRKLRVMTTPQAIEIYYGKNARTIATALVMIRDFAATAGTITATALLATQVFNIELWVALLLTFVFVVVYIILAGQHAVLWTDTIMFFILFIAMVLIVIFGVVECGGWAAFANSISDKQKTFLGSSGLSQISAWIIMGSLVTIGYQSVVQRGYSAKSEEDARWGFVVGGLLGIFIYMFPFIFSMIAVALYGVDIEPSTAYYALISNLFNPVLFGIAIAGFLASSMSSVSSTLLSIGSNLSVDIIGRIKPNIPEKKMMVFNRINIVIAALLSLYFAYLLPMVQELFYIGGRILGAGLSPYIIAIVFFPDLRKYQRSVTAAMIGGGVATTFFIMFGRTVSVTANIVNIWAFDPIYPGLIANFAVLFIGIMMEKKANAKSYGV